jgi:hypothetical protein
MCMAFKDMGCPFIKFHPESTACPSTDIDMVRTLLVKRPPSFNASKHPSSNLNTSSSSSNTTASSVTDNYDSRNQSTSFGSQLNRPKNIPPLPHNFNIYEQCKNCYWSGLDHGQHSAQRRDEWQHHGTAKCPWHERKSQLNQQKSARFPFNANSSSSTHHTSPPASVLTSHSSSSSRGSSVRSRSTQDDRDRDRSRSRDHNRSRDRSYDTRGRDRNDRDEVFYNRGYQQRDPGRYQY